MVVRMRMAVRGHACRRELLMVVMTAAWVRVGIVRVRRRHCLVVARMRGPRLSVIPGVIPLSIRIRSMFHVGSV